MTLNGHFYARHREAVERKLAASASDFIAALQIAWYGGRNAQGYRASFKGLVQLA